MRRNYDVVPKWFSKNQMLSSMGNSSETDLKKNASLKQNQNSPQIMSAIAKKKKGWPQYRIREYMQDFNTLNYPKASINTYNTGD